jgi:hypothetical protein
MGRTEQPQSGQKTSMIFGVLLSSIISTIGFRSSHPQLFVQKNLTGFPSLSANAALTRSPFINSPQEDQDESV